VKAKYAIPLGFIGVILAGAGLFCLPVAGGLGFLDALFTSCSAVCITGLTVIDPGVSLTTFGRIVLLTLVEIGCTGIMTFGTFILVVAGQRLSLAQEFSLSNAYGVKGVKGFRGLVLWVVLSMLAIEALGAWALNAELHDPFRACYYSVMAFCNAGFTMDPGGLEHFAHRPLFLVEMGMLIVIGGLGFMVIYNFCTIKFWRRSLIKQGRLSLHTRVVVWATLAFVAGAYVIFLVSEYGRSLVDFPWREKLAITFLQAVTPRTSGFSVVPLEALHPFTRFFSEILMFIGAAPGSAGGGIKITTFVVFLCTVHSYCRRRREVVLSKRTIPPETIREALIITFTFFFCIALTTAALLVTEHGGPAYDFEKLLFEAVSAVTTTGLAFSDTTVLLSQPGRLVVMIAMFVGRLGALTVVLMIAGDDAPETVRYPKEDVLVG
jgi:trk system potassium uptake protein TrkH